jgi:hypothetical protein
MHTPFWQISMDNILVLNNQNEKQILKISSSVYFFKLSIRHPFEQDKELT